MSGQPAEGSWLEPFVADLKAAGERALELGCGPGDDAALLVNQGFRVAGCDRSPDALRRAAALAPGASVFRADISRPLPVRSASIDVVVASLSLHYLAWAPTLAAFAEIARVLHPGGAFVFRVNATDDTNFGAGQGEQLEPNYHRMSASLGPGRPVKRFFDEASLRAALAGHFTVRHLAHRTINRYDLPKRVWECLATQVE